MLVFLHILTTSFIVSDFTPVKQSIFLDAVLLPYSHLTGVYSQLDTRGGCGGN